MLESIAGIFTSSAIGPILGPIIGFAGGVVNQYMAYKVKRLDIEDNKGKRQHEKDLAVINFNREKEITALEIEGRANQASLEGEIEIEKMDLGNLGLSIGADKAAFLDPDAQKKSKVIMWAMAFVDFVRGLIRPVLTAFLVYVSWEITVTMLGFVQTLNNGGLPTNLVVQLTEYAVVSVMTLTLTAAGYWFGSRPTVLRGQKDD